MKTQNIIISLILLIGLSMFALYIYRNHLLNNYYNRFFKKEVFRSKEFERNLNYALFIPNAKNNKKVPLLVYLHPWGNGGNDNKKQISGLGHFWAARKSQRKFPCYILAPQCPANLEWVNKGPMNTPLKHYNQDKYPETPEMKMTFIVINELINKYNIDTNRIYIIGFSMGATGTWDMLTRYPDIYAGALIAAGSSDTTKAYKLKNIPIWAFSGELDPIAPMHLNKEMTEAININGGNARFTTLKGLGHGIFGKAFKYPGVNEWLFSQRK